MWEKESRDKWKSYFTNGDSFFLFLFLVSKFIRNYFMSSPKHFAARLYFIFVVFSFSLFLFFFFFNIFIIVVSIVYFVYFAWQCHLFNCAHIRILFRFILLLFPYACVYVCYTSRLYGRMNVISVQRILFLLLFYLKTCLALHRVANI